MYTAVIERIKKILDKIRPYLNAEGGDVEFIRFEDGVVYVKMLGACIGCSSIDITVKDGIEALLLEEVPGVIGVELVL
jgi:Fe-S cluster biogenesis protein NfuA